MGLNTDRASVPNRADAFFFTLIELVR